MPEELDAKRFPIPSANKRPVAANELRFNSPPTKFPMAVLLPVTVTPVVPGGVTGTGTRGPALVPGAVAPSRKKPDLDAVNPYDPTTSPFPEQVRA
jgi:hypothetical protein